MQATGGGQSLLERGEHEGEDDLKRAMESINRIGESGGVLRDRCRDPRVSELQEESAPGSKETSASRSTCQMVEPGPNTSSPGPAAFLRTASSPRSKSIAAIDGGFADTAKTVNSAESGRRCCRRTSKPRSPPRGRAIPPCRPSCTRIDVLR